MHSNLLSTNQGSRNSLYQPHDVVPEAICGSMWGRGQKQVTNVGSVISLYSISLPVEAAYPISIIVPSSASL